MSTIGAFITGLVSGVALVFLGFALFWAIGFLRSLRDLRDGKRLVWPKY